MADNDEGRRRKFTPEFKRDAVALVTDTGRSIAEVARELGVYDSTLGNWGLFVMNRGGRLSELAP